MQYNEVELVVTKLLDTKTKKALGHTLIYVQERWVEEHTYEEWIWYEKFIRNLMRKMTPPKTKFISFEQSESNPLELCLLIHLKGCESPCKIVVNNSGLTWGMLDVA
jgi:hypothetical protein